MLVLIPNSKNFKTLKDMGLTKCKWKEWFKITLYCSLHKAVASLFLGNLNLKKRNDCSPMNSRCHFHLRSDKVLKVKRSYNKLFKYLEKGKPKKDNQSLQSSIQSMMHMKMRYYRWILILQVRKLIMLSIIKVLRQMISILSGSQAKRKRSSCQMSIPKNHQTLLRENMKPFRIHLVVNWMGAMV